MAKGKWTHLQNAIELRTSKINKLTMNMNIMKRMTRKRKNSNKLLDYLITKVLINFFKYINEINIE